MKLVNRSGLPEAIVKALENDRYSKGEADYSTTELSVPSRIVALKKQYDNEIEEDVSDRVYALLGSLGHALLERSGTADMIEKRLFCSIAGHTLSGCLDIIDGTTIEDFKFCSVWTAKGKGYFCPSCNKTIDKK